MELNNNLIIYILILLMKSIFTEDEDVIRSPASIENSLYFNYKNITHIS